MTLRCQISTPLVLLLVPMPALAQSAPVDPQPDIVVLGRGLDQPPGSAAYGAVTIDRDRLTNEASGHVEDVLTDVAGLQQFRRSDSRSANPSAQGITLRAIGGNASSRALVLLDGVPLADPVFGYIPFTALSPERLSAVRVTRGSGTGPFGAGAVAGTVELVSADRSDLPLVSGDLSYGSFNSTQLSGAVSPSLGSGYVTLFGRFDRSDGFFTTPDAQRVAATARARYQDWSMGARAVVKLDSLTELQTSLLVFDDRRTLRFTGADSSSVGQDASIRLVRRGDWQIDALAYVQVRNFTNKTISATSFLLALDQYNTPATGMGAKLEVRPPVGASQIVRIGGDLRLAQGTMLEYAYAARVVSVRRSAGGNETTAGLFAEDDWTIGNAVVTGGVRLDHWTIDNGYLREIAAASGAVTTNLPYADRSGTEVTGRLGARLSLGAGVDVRASGYTGFRLPTINELYRSFVVFPTTTQANASLEPERLRGAEIGVNVRPFARASLAITAFYNRLDGAISNITIGPNLRQRQNVDAIVARGIEATAEIARGPFVLTASYAFNDSHVRSDGLQAQLNGLDPAQSPRHAASATLAWQPVRGPFGSISVRYVGKQFEDDLQSAVLKPATTMDLVAGLPLGRRFSVIARVENLFDAEIVTRNSGGTIDLGTPRTLWIGIKFRR